MRKKFTAVFSVFIGMLLLIGCSAAADRTGSAAGRAGSDGSDTESERTQQAEFLSNELALTAYASLLSGDRTLLDDTQLETWWIPDFQDETVEYEYTCLDLDGDGVVELMIQMTENPCGYNAVFHYEDGKLFCWNSDATEMSCRDYPLCDGTMVRQYDYNGVCSYTIFRYQADGEKENISNLFSREELLPEDSSELCPYYEINGTEVDQTTFDQQVAALVTDRMPDRSVWTAV